MVYNFTGKWIKSKKKDAPDALFRNPVSNPENTDTLAELDTNGHPDVSFAELRTLHGDTTESLCLQDSENMLKRTQSISNCGISFYRIPCPPESTTRTM